MINAIIDSSEIGGYKIKTTTKSLTVRIARLIIIAVLVSFGGWCFEKVGRLVFYGAHGDRGFVRLPLCPIYGVTLLSVYLICGTPKKASRLIGGSLVKYFLASTLTATVLELVTGAAMGLLGVKLWDYSERAFNLFGVICLGYSLLWGALITAFMATLWQPIDDLVSRIPPRAAILMGYTSLVLVTADFLVQCLTLI